MLNDYILDEDIGMYYSETLNDWLTTTEYQLLGKEKCPHCDYMLDRDEICWGLNH